MSDARAFIFDLDGTLIDSLEDIAGALNAALAALARAPAPVEQVGRWVGDGVTVLCQRALPDGDPSTLSRLAQMMRAAYQAHYLDHTRPYPNILPMLKLLIARGSPCAVLSNKPHDMSVQIVERLGLRGYFEDVRGCTHDEERKPSPAAALELARRLGVVPASIFFVGDSPVDILTARNAGMIAVSVTWGLRPKEELQAAGPDFVVDDPLQLPDLPGGTLFAG